MPARRARATIGPLDQLRRLESSVGPGANGEGRPDDRSSPATWPAARKATSGPPRGSRRAAGGAGLGLRRPAGLVLPDRCRLGPGRRSSGSSTNAGGSANMPGLPGLSFELTRPLWLAGLVGPAAPRLLLPPQPGRFRALAEGGDARACGRPIVVLLVLALAGLTLLSPTRDQFVVFAIDRSLSVGDDSRKAGRGVRRQGRGAGGPEPGRDRCSSAPSRASSRAAARATRNRRAEPAPIDDKRDQPGRGHRGGRGGDPAVLRPPDRPPQRRQPDPRRRPQGRPPRRGADHDRPAARPARTPRSRSRPSTSPPRSSRASRSTSRS